MDVNVLSVVNVPNGIVWLIYLYGCDVAKCKDNEIGKQKKGEEKRLGNHT